MPASTTTTPAHARPTVILSTWRTLQRVVGTLNRACSGARSHRLVKEWRLCDCFFVFAPPPPSFLPSSTPLLRNTRKHAWERERERERRISLRSFFFGFLLFIKRIHCLVRQRISPYPSHWTKTAFFAANNGYNSVYKKKIHYLTGTYAYLTLWFCLKRKRKIRIFHPTFHHVKDRSSFSLLNCKKKKVKRSLIQSSVWIGNWSMFRYR